MVLSNHKLAERYKEKERLLGKEVLKIRYEYGDRVLLESVLDSDNTGKLVIPRFITDISNHGVLKGCRYSEIQIDGDITDISSLCSCMESSSIKITIRDSSKIKNMRRLFEFSDFEYIDISGIDTRGVRDLTRLFNECRLLKDIQGLNSIDTSGVVRMSRMFSGCVNLKGVDVSNFNTSNVEYMDYMFNECSSIESLDLSNFDIDKVVNMNYMMNCCSSLSKLRLMGINKDKVSKSKMLYNCSNLSLYNIEWIGVCNR